jgi:hypothetical protein
MDDATFWALIDEARDGLAPSANPDSMQRVLKKHDDATVIAFGRRFYEKVCELNSWRLCGAGYIIAGGMSDDSFHYFRSWIVGKGEHVFDVALQDPDSLGPHVDDCNVDNEGLEYAAQKVLKARGNATDPRDEAIGHADAEPSGEPLSDDDEALAQAYPKLADQFA